jgi:hypothetical protein
MSSIIIPLSKPREAPTALVKCPLLSRGTSLPKKSYACLMVETSQEEILALEMGAPRLPDLN